MKTFHNSNEDNFCFDLFHFILHVILNREVVGGVGGRVEREIKSCVVPRVVKYST